MQTTTPLARLRIRFLFGSQCLPSREKYNMSESETTAPLASENSLRQLLLDMKSDLMQNVQDCVSNVMQDFARDDVSSESCDDHSNPLVSDEIVHFLAHNIGQHSGETQAEPSGDLKKIKTLRRRSIQTKGRARRYSTTYWRLKWRSDHRSCDCDLSNRKVSPKTVVAASTGFEPMASAFRCSAPPTELWNIPFTGTMNSINWPVPNVWVFIAQLVEHSIECAVQCVYSHIYGAVWRRCGERNRWSGEGEPAGEKAGFA